MKVNRRDILACTGVAAMATAAGCLDSVGLGSSDSPPTYANWFHSSVLDEGVTYGYIDFRTIIEFEDEYGDDTEDFEDLEDPDGMEDDYILEFADYGVELVSWGLLGLGAPGLGELMDEHSPDDDEADEDEDTPFDSQIDEVIVTDGLLVLIGDFEVDEIDDVLVSDTRQASYVYEITDTVGDYDLYTADEDGDTQSTVAVGSDALVIGEDDAVESVPNALEADTGEADRAIDQSDDLEWLTATSGDGLYAFGSYGHESEEDGDDQISGQDDSDDPWSALGDPDGVVASVTMDEPGKITADFAAIIDDPDEDHLENVLGESAQERSFDIDGDRVSVSATWEGE